MNIIGIIIESNPFHNGHLYFVNQIKSKLNPDIIVAVTSTSFTMRGEISVIDKYQKTNALLNSGVNVVLEFPFILSTQSSDYFALNAVNILHSFGVNHIVCGCETTNINFFDKIFEIETSNDFNNILKNNLKDHHSYKKTFSNSLSMFNLNDEEINLFQEPNFTLAYQYYKVIRTKFSNLSFSLIQRTNHYDDLKLNDSISSAKAIRSGLLSNQDINNFVPYDYSYTNLRKASDNLFNILKYSLLINNFSLNIVVDKERISNLIQKNINNTNSYDDLINLLANKRYSKSRIRRYLLYLILNISEFYHETNYLRILGIDEIGSNYINTLDKNTKKLIFAGINEEKYNSIINEIAKIELKTSHLYSIICENQEIINNEFKFPIRKKDR